MLKVLYVASEAVPFVKTGGLADVAGSLPKELKQKGVDVRVVIPKYSGIKEEYRNNMEHIYDGEINVSWRKKYLGIDRYDYKDVPFYFIDNQEYFYREGYYGYPDDVERFTFFCRAVLEMLPHIDFWPDVIHMNDWQTGLISVYLKLEHNEDVRYNKIKTVYTIHNLKYQGRFWKGYLPDVLGLDWKYFNNGDLEYFDDINFMKGAIVYSDKVTTVSRSYAKEIQDPYYGEGLEGMLQKRDADLSGIINGLDYEDYNPETDKYIFKNFDVHNAIAIKGDNKEQLQKKLGLPVNRKIPMIGMVTRLVEAKGLDLVTRILDELLEYENVQFVILGTGDRQYEDWFKGLVWRYPKKVSANIFFNNELAHQIYAASDLFLMPSQYEPCGIGQLIALRYGTVPIVRATGGLKDSELLLIGGESGGGKSMLLMNMSIQIWLQDNDPFKITNYKQGYNIVYFTLEMPIKPCFNRLAARMAEVPSKKIRNATLEPDEFSRLKSVLNFMEDYNFEFKIIDIPRGSNIDSIETAYEDCLNEFEPDIVAIDYLGLMEPKKKGDDDWIRLGYVAEEMHEFARKTKKTVLSAVQLNRTKSKDLEDKIGLHRIGRSGLIMHNANIGIQIETRPNEKQYPDLNYHLIKNRDGELTSGKLNKDFVCGRLTDINTINENDLNSMFKEVSFEKLKF